MKHGVMLSLNLAVATASNYIKNFVLRAVFINQPHVCYGVFAKGSPWLRR